MSRFILSSYKPMCFKGLGTNAIKQYNLPPYIDHSIRREPSLQMTYPGITATCRASKLAPRLEVDDVVVLITKKYSYDGLEPHWRLVAVLKVKNKFENHQEAAKWFVANNLPIPSNCINGNNYEQYQQTLIRQHRVRLTNICYIQRVNKNSMYLLCDALYKELYNPPIITEQEMIEVFGYVKGTQTPPWIEESEYKALLTLKNIIIP